MPGTPSLPTSELRPPARLSFAPYRLRRHADYGPVYAASRKYSSPSLSFFFRVREAGTVSASLPRVGLTAGRVLGKAVDRNRIKRRMREAVRLHVELLLAPSVPPVDVVLHPRRTVLALPFDQLQSEVAAVLGRVAAMAPRGPEPPRADRDRPRKAKKASAPAARPQP